MNKINLSVGSIILLMCVAIVPSFNAQIVSISTFTVDDDYKHTYLDIDQTVVWDNGLHYEGAHPSQRDESYPFEAIAADDFEFENETIVTDIYWIGAYIHPDDGDFDMEIIFYNDGGGSIPGEVYAGPFYFLNKDTNETWFYGYGSLWNTYNVSLPEPIVFYGNVKYWISIQSVGYVPPQWCIAFHYNPIILHMAVWKSEYLGFPEWTDTSIVCPPGYDICFQLIHKENNPPNAPVIDGPGRWPVGKELCYTFHSTDPDGGDVKYIIDWGDGTTNETDFTQACTPVEICHTWEEMDTYVIKAKAVDMWGAESDWGYFEIEIPRNRASYISFLQWFLQRFLFFFFFLIL